MTTIPGYEPRRIPEGQYRFRVVDEPTKRRHTGQSGEFVSVNFIFKASDDNGNNYQIKESFLPWEDRYPDLLLAFGAKKDEAGKVHLGDISFSGKVILAEIKHEPDKNDPTKSWARMRSIRSPEGMADDVPPPDNDEIPF